MVMPYKEQNFKMDGPDIISSATSIRLPGIAGPVSWTARIDLDQERLKVLKIELPNGITDIINFNSIGVHVEREIGDKTTDMTPALMRQILQNAYTISGLQLQLAIERVFNHDP